MTSLLPEREACDAFAAAHAALPAMLRALAVRDTKVFADNCPHTSLSVTSALLFLYHLHVCGTGAVSASSFKPLALHLLVKTVGKLTK